MILSVDGLTLNMIKQLFEAEVVIKVAGPKQEGPTNCGLNSTVNSVSLVYGRNPVHYQQYLMRYYFVKCCIPPTNHYKSSKQYSLYTIATYH